MFNEKYVDDQFYGFSRGDMFVALTNQINGETHREVPNSGFREGQTVCNIFYATDCVVIKNGNLPVYLENGEVKIFVPKGSAFFTQEVELVQ
jgi:alpha-amylase